MPSSQTTLWHFRPSAVGLAFSAALLGSACGDDPSSPPAGAGDPENISHVIITLTPVGGGAAVTSETIDPDGSTLPDPPEPPSATLALTKGTVYNGTITLLNDIDPSNVINITNEVVTEANFHRFFYTITADTLQPGTTSTFRPRTRPG